MDASEQKELSMSDGDNNQAEARCSSSVSLKESSLKKLSSSLCNCVRSVRWRLLPMKTALSVAGKFDKIA